VHAGPQPKIGAAEAATCARHTFRDQQKVGRRAGRSQVRGEFPCQEASGRWSRQTAGHGRQGVSHGWPAVAATAPQRVESSRCDFCQPDLSEGRGAGRASAVGTVAHRAPEPANGRRCHRSAWRACGYLPMKKSRATEGLYCGFDVESWIARVIKQGRKTPFLSVRCRARVRRRQAGLGEGFAILEELEFEWPSRGDEGRACAISGPCEAFFRRAAGKAPAALRCHQLPWRGCVAGN